MSVTVSKTHNLVTDLSDMLSQGKTPKVYFTLFDSRNSVAALKEALNVLDMEISGCVLDAEVLKLRNPSMHGKIRAVSRAVGYDLISLEEFRSLCKTEKVVLVVKNNEKYYHRVISFFENRNVDCNLFHYSEIQNSTIVNDTVRVINRIGYLDSWPWFMDILNKDMPADQRGDFRSSRVAGRVISDGNCYYLDDFKSPFSEIRDGFRMVPGYQAGTGKKYTVTLLGDSRFVNIYAPSEMTMAAYLQKALNDAGRNCEVRNFSVRANVVQNQFAMLRRLSLTPEDIVICTICPAKAYYELKQEIGENTQLLQMAQVRIMKEMTEYCESRGSRLLFVYLPKIGDIPNATAIEKFIADSYGIGYEPDRMHDKLLQMCMMNGVRMIDLTEYLINQKRTSLYIDYSHFSPEGSELAAGALTGYIEQAIDSERFQSDAELTETTEKLYESHRHFAVESQYKGMWDYLQELGRLSEGKPENCGAIVMNCNPFTLGHRYLIETARAQVDHLYILAVEEDRSVFKFKDRIEMMRRGVADIPGVEVIPSGKFVISALTFPEYFEKGALQDQTIDTTTDIEIFCTKIAPALHIKTRFVGEEPLDRVTNQYNMRMKEMLPEYGMKLVEIRRKESGEAVISASRVRKLLQEKQYDEVKKLVPPTTYDYLLNVLGF